MSVFQSSDRQREYALAFLRVIVGVIFVAHGAQKLFTFGIEGTIGGFTQVGIPLPGVVGPFIAGLEFFGGIALILGLLTRLVSLGLAFDMLGALTFVHMKNGFFSPNGYEFVLLLFASAALFAISGAGRLSLDGLLARRRNNLAATASP